MSNQVGSSSAKENLVNYPNSHVERVNNHDQAQDPYVIALHDKGIYDSDKKSVVNEGYPTIQSHLPLLKPIIILIIYLIRVE
jgi:hypothetical protein